MSAWKPSVCGRSTISSSSIIRLPTVHAAPADLAFGGQPLAVVLGDLAGLAERLGDPLLVALRVVATMRPTPQAESIRTTPLGRTPSSRSCWAMRQPLRTWSRNFCAILAAAHRRAAAGRRPDRRDDRADLQVPRPGLVGQRFELVVGRSRC